MWLGKGLGRGGGGWGEDGEVVGGGREKGRMG